MNRQSIVWNEEKIFGILSLCKGMYDFKLKYPMAYRAAYRLNLLNKVRQFYNFNRHKKYTVEELKEIASKYRIRYEFKKNNLGAYKAALRRNILDDVCSHMPKHAGKGRIAHNRKWTLENLEEYIKQNNIKNRGELHKKHKAVARAIFRLGFMDILFKDVPILMPRFDNIDFVHDLAKKCNYRSEFEKKYRKEYYLAVRWGKIDEFCSHMKDMSAVSNAEIELFNIIKKEFLDSKKLKLRKLNIEKHPYVKGFDLDIFIPSLNKGIEYDGIYWHSFEGLKTTKKNWPTESIKNYHKIKDEFFLSKGIKVLHIKEEDWLKNKEKCIKQCFNFLRDKYAS